MALIKGDGSFRVVTGRLIKDAVYKQVGAKNTNLTTLAVAYGAEKNEIINVKVWYDGALAVGGLKKNDRVLAGGVLKSNEYNGKTYWELEADYVQPMSMAATVEKPSDDFTDVSTADIPF